MNNIIKGMFGTAGRTIRISLEVMCEKIDNVDCYTNTNFEEVDEAIRAIDDCYAILTMLPSTVEVFANYAGLQGNYLKCTAGGKIGNDCDEIRQSLVEIEHGLRDGRFEEITDIKKLLNDAFAVVEDYNELAGNPREPRKPCTPCKPRDPKCELTDEEVMEALKQGKSWHDIVKMIADKANSIINK